MKFNDVFKLISDIFYKLFSCYKEPEECIIDWPNNIPSEEREILESLNLPKTQKFLEDILKDMNYLTSYFALDLEATRREKNNLKDELDKRKEDILNLRNEVSLLRSALDNHGH